MKLLSPVFTKEMVTLARRKRHFLSRALLLGALLIAIWTFWAEGTRRLQYGGFMDTSFLGRDLFMAFTVTQLIAVVVLIPALTAPVIAAEKAKDTLSLLLISNLKRYNILLDKLLSRILLMSLLLFSGLPLFLALLAFGGITPGEILAAYAAIFATMLFCSGLGLLFSTLLNTMHTAMIATYAAMACYFFGLIFLADARILYYGVMEYLLPFGFLSSRSGVFKSVFFFVLSMLVFTTSLLFCKHVLPGLTGYRRHHLLKRLSAHLSRFFEKHNFGGVVLVNEDKALKDNAILWKESHKHFFSSNTFIIRACYVLLMVSMIASAVLIRDIEAAAETIPLVCAILLVVVGVIASSTAFTSEREKHSFEVLMSSPLTARAIVMAKFIGILKLAVPVIMCMVIWPMIDMLAGYPRHYYRSPGGMGPGFGHLLIAISYLPMLIVAGLYSSAKRKWTASAILQTFLILVAWTAVPILYRVLREFGWGRGWWYSHWIQDRLLSMTPVTATFMLAFGDDLFPWACALMIPCWAGLLLLFILRFDRIIGRQ